MSDLDIVTLGASSQAPDGSVKVQAQIPVGNDGGQNDVEPFDEIQLLQGLGVTSAPWPADDSGHAEGVVVRDCGGRNAVCIGARDTRTASIVGNLKPGDTVVHSTGPEQSAQLQLKEAKRQAVLATKGTDTKQILVLLDGQNDKVQVLAFGGIIEMARSGSGARIVMSDGQGGGIHIEGGQVVFDGTVMLSRNAKFTVATSPTPVTGTVGATTPAPGVFA